MPARDTLVVALRGTVRCRRDAAGPLGLVLAGRPADAPEETTEVAFAAAGPPELPEVLEDVRIERLAGRSFRIESAGREWRLEARSVHVHRDASAAFFAAIPPRPAPLPKRLFWRLVLAAAARPLGRRLLLALRGR